MFQNIIKQDALIRLEYKIRRYALLYVMLVLPLAYFVVFRYVPLYGLQLAFKDFNIGKGVAGSSWVGWRNFQYLFLSKDFLFALRNTFVLSIAKIVLGFPAGVIVAIALSELPSCMGNKKRFFQTVFSLPHFLSWVVVSGLLLNLLGSSGVINSLRELLHLETRSYLTDKYAFIWIIVYSNIWKEVGWGAIIYLATIASISNTWYEAAAIDGASRLQRIFYITLPNMKSIMIVMFILAVGKILSVGFDQVLNMYNPTVYETVDIISTFVYRRTFEQSMDFGIGTAVDLFRGVINFILLYVTNKIVISMGEGGISG